MLLFTLFACGSSEPCTEPKIMSPSQQSEISKSSNDGVVISKEEAALVQPYLDDVRKGVREWSSDSIGICEGKSRDCEKFLGTDVELTEEGTYSIRGEFQAPELQPEGGWKITFSIDCEITRKTGDSESTTSKTYSKEYGNIGHHKEGGAHGHRLSPLYTMKSPSSRGNEKCTWKMEANSLGEPTVWTGTYSIPYKG